MIQPRYRSYGDVVAETAAAPAAPAETSTDYSQYLNYAQAAIPLVAGLLDSETPREKVETLKAKIKNLKRARDGAIFGFMASIYTAQIIKAEGELRAAEAMLAEEERTAWAGDAVRVLGLAAGAAAVYFVIQLGRSAGRK